MRQTNKQLSSLFRLTFVALLLVASTQSYAAFNYTISFTASGATTTVGSVEVKNLTKGTLVTVPEGNTLTLTDVVTAVEDASASYSDIRISQNRSTGISTLSFYSPQRGNAQLSAYGVDGRVVVSHSAQLSTGNNTFELSLPAGIYLVRVSGSAYSYSAKLQSTAQASAKTEIKYLSNSQEINSSPHQAKEDMSEATTMQYSSGDQLLYTATSGSYVASVTDVPSESKTTNFNFATIPTSAIPAGTFTMGSPVTEVSRSSDETQYSVTLTAFRMSKYEITNAQYAAFLNVKNIGSDGLYAAGAYPTQALIYASISGSDWGLHYTNNDWVPVAGYENSPVINVTWYGAKEFATYVGGTLPTEAQWEYACRAGTTTPFNTGNYLTNLQANYDWDYPYNGGANTSTTEPGRPQTVGTYAANAYGLYDMHGNVWEWCSDRYGTYPTTAQTDPTGTSTGSTRVIRGGSWRDYARRCRSAIRSDDAPIDYINFIGFRVVLVP